MGYNRGSLCKGGPPVARDIYILITRSNTYFSRFIHVMTDAPYTHASIGLDGLHGDFYSFARKYRLLMLPVGLIKEEVSSAGDGRIRYQMYCLRVSPETCSRLRRRLMDMYASRGRYRYNILGVFTAYFHLPFRGRDSYFCSQFVAEALQQCGALELDKDAALVHPADFCAAEGLELVSEGYLGGFGVEQDLPRPSEVVSVLPFGPLLLRAYRFCAGRI